MNNIVTEDYTKPIITICELSKQDAIMCSGEISGGEDNRTYDSNGMFGSHELW